MSFAPAMASSTVCTSFSAEIYFCASSSKGFCILCSIRSVASGSSPFSFAMVALVRLFGRYGRYRSSTATSVWAFIICTLSSSVNFPCSSIEASTCSFFSSRLRKYISCSCKLLSCSSFREPVASFRYRAINGIVFPSSISLTAASTCHFFTSSSSVSF